MAATRGEEYASHAHRRALGIRVRDLRHERTWTQEQLAEYASMDRSYIAGIESGARNPTLDILQRLASAFGVKLADLF